MVEVAVLQPFLEARSAVAGRAFTRPPDEAGTALSTGLSDALDECLSALAGPIGGGEAVVALGSYGRRELCRHSDVDLMLLFTGEPDQDLINRVLYPLWDSGLRVGHSTRRLQQVAAAARENVQTCTSLLDARLVAGDARLFERLRNELRNLMRRRRAWLHEQLAAGREGRLRREPWQPQEPDVKVGRGGLRSLQTVHWLDLAQALAEGRNPAPLAPALADAREVLLATRHALHALDERPNDRLRRDLVGRVAESLGTNRRDWTRRVTEAMRRVDEATAGALREHAPAAGGSRWRLPGLLRRRPAGPPGDTPSGSADDSDLERLFRALGEFDPGGPLDPLPPSEWLERLLPEWEALRAEPHVTLFHTHPVDVHLCRTVAEVKELIVTDDFDAGTPEAAAAIGDEREILMAAFLHDIGKGREGHHSGRGAVMAERFAIRAGLGEEAAQRLHDAVQHHLLLPDVATRRDISDERVIREVADTVGDIRALNLLYVVSIADARACGSDVWNAWKAQLMRSLYVRVAEALSGVSDRTVTVRRQAAVRELGGQLAPEAVEAHLDQMPVGYLLSMDPGTIGGHIELIEDGLAVRGESGSDGPVAPVLHHDQLGALDRLTIVTGDRPGILQAVAGSLAVHNVNVLGGTAYTREDGVAIDIMHVGDGRGLAIDEQRWDRIFQSMSSALAGEFPIESRLAAARASYGAEPTADLPTTVDVDNASSDEYSIVEVHAADRPGLLYTITTALREMSLDIHMAKVNTFGNEIVDAFYVRRENGRRIEAGDEIERLVARVTSAVAALDGDTAAPARAS